MSLPRVDDRLAAAVRNLISKAHSPRPDRCGMHRQRQPRPPRRCSAPCSIRIWDCAQCVIFGSGGFTWHRHGWPIPKDAIALVTAGASHGSEAAFSCASPRCFHRPPSCWWYSKGARMTAVQDERHKLPIVLDAQRRSGPKLICQSSEPADHRTAATVQDTFSILNFSSDDRIPRRRRSRRLPFRRAAFNQD